PLRMIYCVDPSMISTFRTSSVVFFFHGTATPAIYTLSLHDALPIYHELHGDPRSIRPFRIRRVAAVAAEIARIAGLGHIRFPRTDRKSTRLNSSHVKISYAVFCLKKKKHTSIDAQAGHSVVHTRICK